MIVFVFDPSEAAAALVEKLQESFVVLGGGVQESMIPEFTITKMEDFNTPTLMCLLPEETSPFPSSVSHIKKGVEGGEVLLHPT